MLIEYILIDVLIERKKYKKYPLIIKKTLLISIVYIFTIKNISNNYIIGRSI